MNEKKSNEEKQSIIEKIKTDKKYKAKIELAGYGIVIALIVVYLNISNIGNNYNYDKVIDTNKEKKEEEKIEEINLLEELKDNYTYNIDISMKKISKDTTGKDLENEIKYNYNGKSFSKNLVINKSVDNVNIDYYKIDDKYYEKENEQYNEIKPEIIYDILDEEFIEIDDVKEYIEKSNLDHYTNYSSGKKEYVYNLSISEIIPNYKEHTLVPINMTIENDIVSIIADYTNLLKITDNNMLECIVSYSYKDINKVEEFTIIDTQNEDSNIEQN